MQKDNFGGSSAGNKCIFFNELEYALETTTLFGQTPPRSSQRNVAIRDFNSTIQHLVPVAQPEYVLVPADGSLCPSVQGGIQTFIYPSTNRALNEQLQGLNTYHPTMPYNHSLPVSLSSTQTNQYQSPKSVGVLGASTHSQIVVQVPKATLKVVPDSANVPGSCRPSSKPGRPSKRTLILEKDIFASGAENQSMANLCDLMGLPPDNTNKNEAKITYSILPRSRSKNTCLQPKHRVDLKTLLAESETQSHVETSFSCNLSDKGCPRGTLKVSGPPKKTTKIEYNEDDLDVGSMYQLLTESIDLRAAFASGEIRIEEQKNARAKSSPTVQKTSIAPESNETVRTDGFVYSQSTSREVSADAGEEENKQMLNPKEENETVSLEDIFSFYKTDTQALFEDSFKDVDLDTYLCHEEPSVDNNCLREILDSAEFAELFESSDDDDATQHTSIATPGTTTTPVATEKHPSATEGSLSSVGTDFVEIFGSTDDETTSIITIPSPETQPSVRKEKVNLVPKSPSSMTIEELFLSNRERAMEQIAAKQEQKYQHSFLNSHEFTTPPSKTEALEVVEGTNSGEPFSDYIPDMFLFSATEPDVVLNGIDLTVPANRDQPFIDEIRTPPSPDACPNQPVGHYGTVPEGPLDMMRENTNVYLEKVYKAEGFQYVFDEFKTPGNNIIVDPATLEMPKLQTPGRKRPHSHDNNYMCDDSQSAKKFKVDAGSWVTCINLGDDSVTKSKKPTRRYDNKARNPVRGKWLPTGSH